MRTVYDCERMKYFAANSIRLKLLNYASYAKLY